MQLAFAIEPPREVMNAHRSKGDVTLKVHIGFDLLFYYSDWVYRQCHMGNLVFHDRSPEVVTSLKPIGFGKLSGPEIRSELLRRLHCVYISGGY